MDNKYERTLRFDIGDSPEDVASARRRVWRRRLWQYLRRKEHEGSCDAWHRRDHGAEDTDEDSADDR